MKALFPLKTCNSVYFIPDILSFCIPSVFIFITISCSGLVTLSTQLWREMSLLSRLLYKHNAPFLSTGLESSADTLPLRFGYTLTFKVNNKTWMSHFFLSDKAYKVQMSHMPLHKWRCTEYRSIVFWYASILILHQYLVGKNLNFRKKNLYNWETLIFIIKRLVNEYRRET